MRQILQRSGPGTEVVTAVVDKAIPAARSQSYKKITVVTYRRKNLSQHRGMPMQTVSTYSNLACEGCNVHKTNLKCQSYKKL